MLHGDYQTDTEYLFKKKAGQYHYSTNFWYMESFNDVLGWWNKFRIVYS